jgi:hypothetical protein
MLVDEDVRRLLGASEGDERRAWELGPDAAHGVGDPSAPVECRVLLLFGDQAEVVTPFQHRGDPPLRVPAAELAGQLGVDVGTLAGRRFSGVVAEGSVMGAVLLS